MGWGTHVYRLLVQLNEGLKGKVELNFEKLKINVSFLINIVYFEDLIINYERNRNFYSKVTTSDKDWSN